MIRSTTFQSDKLFAIIGSLEDQERVHWIGEAEGTVGETYSAGLLDKAVVFEGLTSNSENDDEGTLDDELLDAIIPGMI